MSQESRYLSGDWRTQLLNVPKAKSNSQKFDEATEKLVQQAQQLLKDKVRAEQENTILRGIVAKMNKPCHYCGKENMAECPSGFPGCALADDIMCGEDQTYRILNQERMTYKQVILLEITFLEQLKTGTKINVEEIDKQIIALQMHIPLA